MNELCLLSAAEMARRVRAGEIRSVELVEAHLERIAALNPLLNAVVESAADPARAQAREADAARARGDATGPLHGVPFSVKDWIDAAGLRCAGGEVRFRDRVSARDATVVSRMRSAGAILLGKTNIFESPVHGRTNNPYNPLYSTTGSSAGEAALIAACGSPLGLASDSGGSIRQPAHACGIAGLKPTTGRVPLTGHFPFISAMNDPRTTIGPMARTVEDLALALTVISGPDGRDASVIPMPLLDWRTSGIRGLRVAWYTHHAGADPTPEMARACRGAARVLEDAGAVVREETPPRIEEAAGITRAYWKRQESGSPDAWIADKEAPLDGEATARHLFEWDRFRRAMIGFLEDRDLIVTPAAERPATPHGTDAGWIPYTLPYSLTGWPCVVVRAGTSGDGMPIGVQLVARPWRDDVALAAAAVIERVLGGWQPPTLG